MSDPDRGRAPDRKRKLGFGATWSMAVGGMLGGGVFSVLGVVVDVAGVWAWLSFVLAGLVTLCTADSYKRLADTFGEGGGAFTFLRAIDREGLAGSVSWLVILGYVLTIAVYAFTFGHYLTNAFDLGGGIARAVAVGIIALLAAVNLRGIGDAALVEIVTVGGKLAILVGLGVWGLVVWHPESLSHGAAAAPPGSALMGAAIVFMSYEGFQLLAYDYDVVSDADRLVPRAMFTSVVTVIAVYVLVTFGATMLVGADTLAVHREAALARAGRAAAGDAGLWLITVAAVFSTASAINATLFSIGRLSIRVAADGELPSFFAHRNAARVPDRAILVVAAVSAVLAASGTIGALVEAASLGFLLPFTAVNVLAFRECPRRRWASAVGAVGGAAAFVALLIRQGYESPVTPIAVAVLLLLATVGRRLLVAQTEGR